MVNLNIYALLGILEFLMLVGASALVLFVKWRGAQRKVHDLRLALKERPVEIEVVHTATKGAGDERSYTDFLQEQLERSSVLLGSDAGEAAEGAVDNAEDDPKALERQMLAARHQFLQLELDVQALTAGRDVEAQRKQIVSAMQALLAGLHSAAAEPVDEEADGTDAAPASTALDEETKLRSQIAHLRSVIDNQHQVMRDLRSLLEKGDDDSKELHEALRKLDDAELQGRELQRCLEVMDQENERLKRDAQAKGGKAATINPDSDMLRDLVSNQQRTITKLQQALKDMVPDAEQARGFNDAIDKMQRTNNELNSCVMVLEDENSMLRGEVEELKERIADLESSADAHADRVPAAATAVLGATAEVAEEKPEAAAALPANESVADAGAVLLESDDAAEMDIEALLDAAAAEDAAAPALDVAPANRRQDAPATATTDAVDADDIDALLAAAADDAFQGSADTGAVAAGDAPAPAPVRAPAPVETAQAPPRSKRGQEDDTDALLAELLGESEQTQVKR